MTFDMYTRILDALTYAAHTTATGVDTRDTFAALYPEHQAAYIPAGER